MLTNIIGDYFGIYRGVKQGDPLSSPNFIYILENYTDRNMNWIDKGIKIDGCYLSDLRFAGNQVILGNNMESLIQIIINLHHFRKFSELKMNFTKSKILSTDKNSKKN